MNYSTYDYIDLLNDTNVYLNQYIVVIFYILGNVGNLLSALIFSRKSWRKNVSVLYFNICLLYNTCYINSTVLACIFLFGFNNNLLNTNVFLCKIYFYASFLFSTLLPTVLILASIDRLLISSQNVDTRLYSSKRLAYFSISMSTICWSLFFIHAFIKINIQEIYPSIFICYYDFSKVYMDFISYSSLTVNILFFILMIILSIFTFKNVRHIRIIPRQQRNEPRSMRKKDFQLLRCLFVQNIVYIIFSVTLNVNTIYAAAIMNQMRTPLEQAVDYFFANLALFLHHIPYCASFFIFIIVSKAFRHELKQMIYKMCGKEVTLMRKEEHNKQKDAEENNMELNIVAVRTDVSPA